MNYLDEYRRKYGGLSYAKEIGTELPSASSKDRDLDDLLSRYLISNNNNNTISHKPGRSTDPCQNGEVNSRNAGDSRRGQEQDTHQKQEPSKASNIIDGRTEQDDDNILLLPTTTFTDKGPVTVDTVLSKQVSVKAAIKSKHGPVVRCKTGGRRSKSNPLEERKDSSGVRLRLHSSFSSNRLVSDADSIKDDESDIIDLSEISPSVVVVRSDSQKSTKVLKRRDSSLSCNSKGSISREDDIIELSDEESDYEFGEGLNQPPPSTSFNERVLQELLNEIDHQISTQDSTNQEIIDEEIQCLYCTSQSPLPLKESAGNLCKKCEKMRVERQQTIEEIQSSEDNYCQDLMVIKQQFHEPLTNAGLITEDEANAMFANIDQLLAVSRKFCTELSTHIDHLKAQGDAFLQESMIGKLFCESSAMFLAFEAYCLNYNAASVMIEQLKKDKELFNLFLEASQKDNPLLRRMDLKTFLMIPIQRVMKYPLLLQRLLKATTVSHPDANDIKSAIQKLTNILLHINSQSKVLTTMTIPAGKGSTEPKKKASFEIALTKLCLDTVRWNHDEIHFLVSGKVGFLLPSEGQITDKVKNLRFNTAYAVIISRGKCSLPNRQGSGLMFVDTSNVSIKDAAMLFIKKGTSKLQLLREPFRLASCIVSRNSEFYDIFEIHENIKDSCIVRPVHNSDSWFKFLKYFSLVLGGRNQKRRKALPNILLHT